MTKLRKLLRKIRDGDSDANIRFDELRNLLLALSFQERIQGGHHIFTKDGIDEILNLQPSRNGRAKPYQVKQVRRLLWKYNLGVIE
jgi:hypothetical protein